MGSGFKRTERHICTGRKEGDSFLLFYDLIICNWYLATNYISPGISWFSLVPQQDLAEVLDMNWLVRFFRWELNNAKQYSWFLNLWWFRAIVSSSHPFHIVLTWYGVALKLHECVTVIFKTENYLNPNWERGDDAKRPRISFFTEFSWILSLL